MIPFLFILMTVTMSFFFLSARGTSAEHIINHTVHTVSTLEEKKTFQSKRVLVKQTKISQTKFTVVDGCLDYGLPHAHGEKMAQEDVFSCNKVLQRWAGNKLSEHQCDCAWKGLCAPYCTSAVCWKDTKLVLYCRLPWLRRTERSRNFSR